MDTSLVSVTDAGWNPPINRDHRQAIFKQTDQIVKQGGYRFPDGHEVRVSSEEMKKSVKTFEALKAEDLPPLTERYTTIIRVEPRDSFTVAADLAEKYKKAPMVMNMANRYSPGGGCRKGDGAQEESLSYCSNMVPGIDPDENPASGHKYPLSVLGGISSQGVSVIRYDMAQGYALRRAVVKVDTIGVAAFDLRRFSKDRIYLGIGTMDWFNEETLRANEKYMQETEQKIESFLVQAALLGNTELVPGAFGAGVFENPPAIIAELFGKVLRKPNLEGRFREIVFGILVLSPRDQANVDAFKKLETTS